MTETPETMQWAEEQIIILTEAFGRKMDNPETVRMLARQLLAIVHTNEPTKHGKLGVVCPGDWLISQAVSGCEFFPLPLVLRRLYERYWPTGDGKGSEDFSVE